MHIADFNVGHLGANAIVGGSLPTATGAGISMVLQGKDRVTLCFFGDGACNNGVFNESLNMACMEQFAETGVPVIFLIENNQFGMSGRGVGEVTGIDFLARRGWSYNDVGMHAEVVNGMDVLAVYDAVRRAAERVSTQHFFLILQHRRQGGLRRTVAPRLHHSKHDEIEGQALYAHSRAVPAPANRTDSLD